MGIADATTRMRTTIENRQNRIEATFRGFGKGRFGRVIRMARKPETEEFIKSCMIIGAGIALIGIIGFVIWYLMTFLPGWIQQALG